MQSLFPNVIHEGQLTQPPDTCDKLHPRGLVKYNLYKGVRGGEKEEVVFSKRVIFYANKISLQNEPSP